MSSAAGAAAGGAAAEASRVAGIRRKLEGDLMSVWVVNQEKDKLMLAIGFRAKGSRLQAQCLGTGSRETVGKFADDQGCQRVLRDITSKLSDKDTAGSRFPRDRALCQPRVLSILAGGIALLMVSSLRRVASRRIRRGSVTFSIPMS